MTPQNVTVVFKRSRYWSHLTGRSVCFFRPYPFLSYFSFHLCLGFPDGLFYKGFVITFFNFRLLSSSIRTFLIIFHFHESRCKLQAAAERCVIIVSADTFMCQSLLTQKTYKKCTIQSLHVTLRRPGSSIRACHRHWLNGPEFESR